MTEVTTRDRSFEGLRGIAAFVVVFSHLTGILFPYLGVWSFPDKGLQPTYAWEKIIALPVFTIFFNGSFAVAVFFVLSGYVLLAKFWATKEVAVLKHAAYKRFPRLMLPAFFSVMLAWSLMSIGAMQTFRAPEIGGAGWPMAFFNRPISFWEAVWQGSVLASFAGTTPLNHVLWSITIELKGSLALFLAFGVFGKRSLAATALLFFALCIVLYSNNAAMMLPMTIFAGSLLIYVRPWLSGRTVLGFAMMIVGIYFGLYCLHPPTYWPLMSIHLPYLPAPFFDMNESGAKAMLYRSIGAILLVYGLSACTPAAQLLSRRLPVYLGRISFGTYVLHWSIICSFSYWCLYMIQIKNGVEHQIACLLMCASTLVIIAIAGHAFERLVDIPVIRFSEWYARRMMLDHQPTDSPAELSSSQDKAVRVLDVIVNTSARESTRHVSR